MIIGSNTRHAGRVARQIIAGLALASVLLAACSSEASESDISLKQNMSDIRWLPCGVIECGTILVPINEQSNSDSTTSLAMFRRMSTSKNAATLLLIPDSTSGFEARDLVEKAPLIFGSSLRTFDIISVAPRGALGSAMPAGLEHMVSALHTKNDIEQIRLTLAVKKLNVMSWGNSATATAAWVMQNPSTAGRIVLDTPRDPSSSPVVQAEKQIKNSVLGVETALRWCASHLSCPMNANVATELNKFRTNLRLERVGGVNFETVARAGSRALADGHPQHLFDAIADATNGDSGKLLALAGDPPTASDARERCANVTREQAAEISAKYGAAQYRHFGIGVDQELYGKCADAPEASDPLGTVTPAKDAKGANVLVTIARGDPTWAPYVSRTIAKKMNWKYSSVYANRHLVIGFDKAITNAAIAFLKD